MTMPLLTHSDRCAIQRIQCVKQRCRTIALVVVRHRGAAALLQRQTGLSSVQCLNLTFFIDAQKNRTFGRIQIGPKTPNLSANRLSLLILKVSIK